MELTEELKKIYASNPNNEVFYDCIELSHSNFTKNYYFIMDYKEKELYNEEGELVTFEPLGFRLVYPEKGENQQDLKISIDNTNLKLIPELNLASENIEEPIKLKSAVYIDNSQKPQTQHYILELSNIVVNYSNVTATATATDMINISFPKEKFDYRFNGLFI